MTNREKFLKLFPGATLDAAGTPTVHPCSLGLKEMFSPECLEFNRCEDCRDCRWNEEIPDLPIANPTPLQEVVIRALDLMTENKDQEEIALAIALHPDFPECGLSVGRVLEVAQAAFLYLTF